MSTRDRELAYLARMSAWLISLPHDLKVLFEAKDEPNLERAARETAAGAILFILNAERPAGEPDFVYFADDTIIFREALRAVVARGGEGAADFKDRFSEYYDTLDTDLGLCREVMGDDTYGWFAGKIEQLHKQMYKGKKLLQYMDDEEQSEILYEDGLAFATDYPIDEEKLGMRLKKPETLLEPLRKKAAEEKKRLA